MDTLRLLLSLPLLLLGVNGCFLPPQQLPIQPQKIVLRLDATLRDKDEKDGAALASLSKGTTLTVSKVSFDGGYVETPDGKKGWVPRESISQRTALYGTERCRYTRNIEDQLRTVPGINLIEIATVSRRMPEGAAGGVQGAADLAIGRDAELVVGVCDDANQLVYEVVDLKRKAVLGKGQSHSQIMTEEIDEVLQGVKKAVEAGAAGGTAMPATTPAPQ